LFPYILRRIIQMIPLLFIISIVSFLLMTLAPGDPTAMFENPEATEAVDLSAVRDKLGVDQPIYIQYLKWMKLIVVDGDMGYSFQDGRPVLEKIIERIPATLILMGTAIFISFLIATPIGIYSAVKQYSPLDNTFTFFSFLGISIPAFFLALMAMLVFSLKLGWFPASNMRGDDESIPLLWDVLHHLILPASVLAFGLVAYYARYMRSSMLEVIHQDFIRTARAKGVTEGKVILKHALRNALLPMITLLGFQLPNLFGGALIIEQLFAWPGMGRLAFGSIFIRDYQVIMGVTMVTALLVVIGNLIADILYAVVDPRIQYSKT
jgi:peptide/nickel transport system permease protein